LQCPGSEWRGRFSGFEEDTKHWTNQIRVILEIDPESAPSADFFWMIYEDIQLNFDCIMVFSPSSSFQSNLKFVHQWVPKESQFYVPPAPKVVRVAGPGSIQICTAPLLTSAPANDLRLALRYWTWNAAEAPPAIEIATSMWTITSLTIEKADALLELETLSRGGFVLQLLSTDCRVEFEEYDQISCVTACEGDLPFYVCLDDYGGTICTQRFELIGKIIFNLDQPGNVALALFVTNELQKSHMAVLLFNNDTNDTVASVGLRSGSVALTPTRRGYTFLIFGLYGETIFRSQPVDLIGKWRLRVWSDVPLTDIVDNFHSNYTETDGECTEMDETHQISRTVLTGSCEAVVVLETSIPISLTLVSTEDENPINSVRGVAFAVLPTVHIPGEKEQTRLIIKAIASEATVGFTWKLRIFSTAPVTCKEDTAPAEKTAAAIAAWEKKRVVKPPPGKKAEPKSRNSEAPVILPPPQLDPTALTKREGTPAVLTEAQVEAIAQTRGPTPPGPAGPGAPAGPPEPDPKSGPGEEMRDTIAAVVVSLNESWDQYDVKRAQISKLFAPTPPKVEEK
jgi:hypothetical protein